MLNKNNVVIACLAGASAAAVAVLSIGGYFLHKKVLNHRLQEQARRLAMTDFDEDSDLYEDFEDYEDDDVVYEDEYLKSLMEELDGGDDE